MFITISLRSAASSEATVIPLLLSNHILKINKALKRLKKFPSLFHPLHIFSLIQSPKTEENENEVKYRAG